MKSTVLWTLIVLNVALLGSFIWRLVPPNAAMAQQAAPAVRRVPDYLLIPAEVNGGASGIVVVLDQSDGILSAMSYDDANGSIQNMPKVDLGAVFRGTTRPGARGAAAPAGR